MGGTAYKNMEIYDGTPSGAAGVALNDNFTTIADRAGSYIENASDPDANDDDADTNGNGTAYQNSIWLNTTDKTTWRCIDATATAAVWKHLGIVDYTSTTIPIDGVRYPKTATGIQAALDTLASGGAILLPAETIALDAQLDITNDNVTIIGQGLASELSRAGNVVDFDGADGCMLLNLKISGTVECNDSDGFRIDGCEIDATGETRGVYFHSESLRLNITNCYIHDADTSNVYGITKAHGERFINNRFDGAGVTNIYLDGDGVGSIGVTFWNSTIIANNHICNAGTQGLYVRANHDLMVKNNNFERNDERGIYLVGPIETQIDGNFFEYNTNNSASEAAIYVVPLSTAGYGNTIQGLCIRDNLFQGEERCISIQPTAAYPLHLVIANNMILRCESDGIVVNDVEATWHVDIHGNQVTGLSVEKPGIMVIGVSDVTEGKWISIHGNSVYNATYGVWVEQLTNVDVYDNQIYTCTYPLYSVTNSTVRFDHNYLYDQDNPPRVGGGGTYTAKGNYGHTTEANGEATISNGTVLTNVTHGLDQTPAAGDIVLTPTSDLGNAVKYWISDVGATTFRINVDADPGADKTIGWHVAIR